MKKYLAYIDESGDPIFNDQASNIFFVCATVINEESYEEISTELQEIKKRFGINEFKSSKVTDFKRRFSICNDLAKLDIQILTIWVRKKELKGDWFRSRSTFYKYIQMLLHREIFRIFEDVHVSLDKYGSPEYQKSLRKYLIKSLQGELFEHAIEIGTAKQESLIQISDFLAGTLRKALNLEFEDNGSILNILKPLWKVRLCIPNNGKFINPEFFLLPEGDLDFCIKEAHQYLEKNKDREKDPKIKSLEYL
ncbi:MAG: DUF3800 domain-containing protein, partial [Syntrophothermus sp.]